MKITYDLPTDVRNLKAWLMENVSIAEIKKEDLQFGSEEYFEKINQELKDKI